MNKYYILLILSNFFISCQSMSNHFLSSYKTVDLSEMSSECLKSEVDFNDIPDEILQTYIIPQVLFQKGELSPYNFIKLSLINHRLKGLTTDLFSRVISLARILSEDQNISMPAALALIDSDSSIAILKEKLEQFGPEIKQDIAKLIENDYAFTDKVLAAFVTKIGIDLNENCDSSKWGLIPPLVLARIHDETKVRKLKNLGARQPKISLDIFRQIVQERQNTNLPIPNDQEDLIEEYVFSRQILTVQKNLGKDFEKIDLSEKSDLEE